jgi:hypothetical protein
MSRNIIFVLMYHRHKLLDITDFPLDHHVQMGLGPSQPTITRVQWYNSPGVHQLGCEADHSHPYLDVRFTMRGDTNPAPVRRHVAMGQCYFCLFLVWGDVESLIFETWMDHSPNIGREVTEMAWQLSGENEALGDNLTNSTLSTTNPIRTNVRPNPGSRGKMTTAWAMTLLNSTLS